MILGNDCSEFQGNIDFDTYKNNSNFVIIRATYGNGYTDKQFFRNRDEARRVGLPRGFYHYCYPQYNKPEDEADWFLKQCTPLEEESLYLDYEEHYTGDGVAWCKTFLDRIQLSLPGYKPLMYLNQSLATSLDWTTVIDGGYGLWIAAYTYDPKNNNFQIGKWPFAAAQQWTDKQQVPGITGNVDGDVFFGDVTTFKKYGYSPQVISFPDPCADVKRDNITKTTQIMELTKQNEDLQTQLSLYKASHPDQPITKPSTPSNSVPDTHAPPITPPQSPNPPINTNQQSTGWFASLLQAILSWLK